MDFKIENFIPAHNLEVLRTAGLHKIAGAMAGIDEMTIKEAVAILGAKAYFRRREVQKIATGLEALAELSGEKRGSAWEELLQRAALPAMGGAAIAAAPQLLGQEPMDQGHLLSRAGLGAALGGLGGMGVHMNKSFEKNPGMAATLFQ